MQLSEVDLFFTEHPLKESYFSFSETERAGTLAVAERDVRAVTAGCSFQGEQLEFFQAAIAEQTIFLLLNPEYLTGAYTRMISVSSAGNSRKFNGDESVLGQRAAALLVPLLAKTEPENDGKDKEDGIDGENGISDGGILRLCRG